MTRVRNITAALAALCLLAVAAPAAYALDGNYHHVISECYNTGRLPGGKYTHHALLQARHHLPTDIREYSDCADLINAALAWHPPRGGGSSGGGLGGGGGYSPPLNPALTTPSGAVASNQQDFNALEHQTNPKTRPSAPPKVDVAGSRLSPSTGGLLSAARRAEGNRLPLVLILALAGLAALALLAGTALLRGRWPQTRRAALRLIGR